jgi:integrase
VTNPSLEAMVAETLAIVKGGQAQPVPIAHWIDEVTRIYLTKAKATRIKMAQALREIAAIPGVRTTADLTRGRISEWVAQQEQWGRRPNTIKGLLSPLRAACYIAADEGWLARVPFSRRWHYVRGEVTSKTHHSVQDLARVLDYLAGRVPLDWQDHRLYVLFATYAFTGLRKCEALYLDWEDVRLKERYLLVNPLRRRTKTEASAAPVPLPPALVKILRSWRPACGSPWVFPTVNREKPWTGGIAGTKPLDRIKAAGQACGVPGLTILSLRHSWATAAEHLWGLTAPQIQRVLRHTTVKTQEGYRHPDREALKTIGSVIKFPTPAERRRRA